MTCVSAESHESAQGVGSTGSSLNLLVWSSKGTDRSMCFVLRCVCQGERAPACPRSSDTQLLLLLAWRWIFPVVCISSLYLTFVWLSSALSSSALLTGLGGLPEGAHAVHDEVTAGPETAEEDLSRSPTTTGSHRQPTPGVSEPLGAGPGLSAACDAARAPHAPADVWRQHGQHGQHGQHVRLGLLPGESPGRRRGGGGGGGRLQQPAGSEPPTGPGLSQQPQESGVWFGLLWGVVAGGRGCPQEDEERAGLFFSLPPDKQSAERTHPTQIHLRCLPGEVDVLWGQRPRGLDKLFIDQGTQPPASGPWGQQLCRPHTELDGFARLPRACWPEAELQTKAGKRLLCQHEEETCRDL